jgi:hypothetical protein
MPTDEGTDPAFTLQGSVTAEGNHRGAAAGRLEPEAGAVCVATVLVPEEERYNDGRNAYSKSGNGNSQDDFRETVGGPHGIDLLADKSCHRPERRIPGLSFAYDFFVHSFMRGLVCHSFFLHWFNVNKKQSCSFMK